MRRDVERCGPRRESWLPLFTVRFQCIVWTAVCLSWSTVQGEEYRYPYRDPYLATVTTAILNADGMTPRLKREAVHVPVLAGRRQLPALDGRDAVSVALYRQDHPAPLLFILAGIGSNPYFGLGTYFAWPFHQQGFHVAILPSPMSWNFARRPAEAARPGTPRPTPVICTKPCKTPWRSCGLVTTSSRRGLGL